MERLDVTKAVTAIKSVLPGKRPIGHHDPFISGTEYKHLKLFCEKGITNHDYTEWFEEKIRLITGAEQCIAVSNGTAALHLALMAIGVERGDEVLVPSLTYAATANAIAHLGAIPNFIDGRICLNPYKLECYLERETVASEEGGRINKATMRPITALVMVHLLGIPCDVLGIRKLTNRYGLKLIEDAAEAIGSMADNMVCGSMGDISIVSFNHNKIVTTGGGGAVLSDDPYLIAKAYHLAHQGKVNHPWTIEHDAIGWNYALPSVCAALGVSQLEQLNEIMYRKRKLHESYFDALAGVGGLSLMGYLDGHNCWLNTVFVDHPKDRDPLLDALHKEAIHARALFTPLHLLHHFRDNPRDANMGYCEQSALTAVCLPSGAGLAS